MIKTPKELNRKSIKKLPTRSWDTQTEYKDIFLVPSGLIHDSGYMTIAIVGRKENGNFEVAAYPDDVCWNFMKLFQDYDVTGMRTDCYYPNGVLHFWGNKIKFIVERAYSSTTIRVEQKDEKQN